MVTYNSTLDFFKLELISYSYVCISEYVHFTKWFTTGYCNTTYFLIIYTEAILIIKYSSIYEVAQYCMVSNKKRLLQYKTFNAFALTISDKNLEKETMHF